jgi:DNA-binding IclR family transcriptional regulator
MVKSGKSIKPSVAESPGSLNRAALIMTVMARGSSKGSKLTDLVARTGLPRTTVVRVLEMLAALGWVTRDVATARYNLGIDLAGLGYSAISRNPIERMASTELSQLAEKLNQIVYLSIRSGLDIICIGRYESKSDIQIGRGGVGLRGPLGMTQSCMGMLACLPQQEVEEIVEANMSRYHRVEGFDETGFRKALADAARNGYGTYDNIILDRTTSGLGVAIRESSGYPIAGIGTTFITGWLTEEQRMECLAEMKKSVANIEAILFRR